jgi:Calcineurin-like phosphoesterase
LKKHPIKIFLLIFCILFLSGFELLGHFSPLPGHEWNTINLTKIKVPDPSDFSFAVFGDNRRSNFVFENLLKLVDHDPDITFGIDLGDLVSRGKKRSYRHFIKQVKGNMALPLLTAIGNRELKGEGRALYRNIFGPLYYSFKIGRNYFMVLDNANGKGLDREQRLWLEKELEKSLRYDTRIIFMHVPLYDPREMNHHHGLDEESADKLKNLLLKYRVTHVFASHIHGYFEGRWEGIPYTITGGAGISLAGDDPDHFFFHFVKVHIKNGSLNILVKHVPPPKHQWLDLLDYMASLYLYSFF